MTRRLFAAVVIIVLGAAGPGQAEFIGVFKDTNGCPCEIIDRGTAGLLSVVVLHVDSPGAKASQFWVPTPQCAMWTCVGEVSPFYTVIGNTQAGIAIGYDGCKTGTFLLVTINFFVQGLTEDCCNYSVEPYPGVPSGQVEIVNCSDDVVFTYGGWDLVNSNTECVCAPGPVMCYPVPVKQSTWGGIKKLYR